MIKVTCTLCATEFNKSPSRVTERNYCSRKCQLSDAGKYIAASGTKTRFYAGNKRPKEWTEKQTEKVSGVKNYAWKGENVGNIGLHNWIRRQKGHPDTCTKCGKFSKNHRQIQWANIDGKYRRHVDDFIALCCSCHKLYDRAMAKKNKG